MGPLRGSLMLQFDIKKYFIALLLESRFSDGPMSIFLTYLTMSYRFLFLSLDFDF